MALERGQTMADVLRDEVCRGAWLDDELRQRHRVLIERGQGRATELTFAHESLLNPAGRPIPQDVTPHVSGWMFPLRLARRRSDCVQTAGGQVGDRTLST
jgi:hypothetical protein